MATADNDEERVTARGLKSPGPLLIVKKRLKETSAPRMRIIVSSREAASDLVNYFEARNASAEIDLAGEDIHVVVDLTTFKDAE